MDPQLKETIDRIEEKINAVYDSVEKTRKYFLIIMWLTIAVVVLPAIGLIFVLPSFIDSYTKALDGLL